MDTLNWFAVTGLGLKLIFVAIMVFIIYKAYGELRRPRNEYTNFRRTLMLQVTIPTVLVALSLPSNFVTLHGSNELSILNVSRILVNLAILSFGVSYFVQYNYNKLFNITNRKKK